MSEVPAIEENEARLRNRSDWEYAMLVKRRSDVLTELPTTLELSVPTGPSWEIRELA